MRIVLVRPNYESHIITPPLGLGYLASYLKQHKIDVRIIDGLRDNLSPAKIVEQILSFKPDAVGITCLTSFYHQVVDLSLALKVKKPEIKCIIGGIHPTFLPYETLADSKADFIVCGEGEGALLKLIKANFSNKGIRGVYSQKDALERKVIKKAEIIEDLDNLPFPDWEQIDPSSYPKAPHGAVVNHFPVGIIISSRGCPYPCTYCASPGFCERKIRFRSPENVVDEIIFLHREYGVKEIHFEDDNLTMKRSHIQKICEL
ncbi:MAG: radical SAM protein, partial [bacterium]|nr:radical SAM protein [bacterium]